jgi:hypothetical protein
VHSTYAQLLLAAHAERGSGSVFFQGLAPTMLAIVPQVAVTVRAAASLCCLGYCGSSHLPTVLPSLRAAVLYI